jgi:hypothetical protein
VVAQRVNIAGFDATMKALKEYDEVQYQLVQREITKAAEKIRAETLLEIFATKMLSNWGPWTHARDGRDFSFNAYEEARTIKISRGSGKIKRQKGRFVQNGIGVYTSSAAMQIFHTVGHARARTTARKIFSAKGQSFVPNAKATFPVTRGLWAAGERNVEDAQMRILSAVQEAQRITNRTTA